MPGWFIIGIIFLAILITCLGIKYDLWEDIEDSVIDSYLD